MNDRTKTPPPLLPNAPGESTEMTPREAADFGAFEETALSESEAAQSNILPEDNRPDVEQGAD